MYSRMIQPPKEKSFFLFGPRGSGKTSWVKDAFPDAIYLDLLESELYNDLLAAPQRLAQLIPQNHQNWVIVDEVQKVPALLDEVHRLIEARKLRFILTGSSARKLRAKGVNLLAGRALTYEMHPLTARELGNDFHLEHSLRFGHLPCAYTESDPQLYLESYVKTYFREEVQQEGLTRNLGAFARFLESASFSQASPLNISEVARDCSVERKVTEHYFGILDDSLLATRLPVFSKKAKRKTKAHPKFFFFDVGVFRTLRPKGPLDFPEEIEGVALETLVFQELKAVNANLKLGYELFYWKTASQLEIDFVLYGDRGLVLVEIKRTRKLKPAHFRALREFMRDYPMSKAFIFFGGQHIEERENILCIPFRKALNQLPDLLKDPANVGG